MAKSPKSAPAKHSAKARKNAATPKPRGGAAASSKGLATSKAYATLANWLQLAQLRAEKCELKEARVAYAMALTQAKKLGDLRATMEALSGLLRLSAEALDEQAMQQWDAELDALMSSNPKQVPPMAWHCKGAVANHRKQPKLAQRYFHRYLRAVRNEGSDPAQVAKGWTVLTMTLWQRGRLGRAEWLAHEVLRRYEAQSLRGINGIIYLILAIVAERR